MVPMSIQYPPDGMGVDRLAGGEQSGKDVPLKAETRPGWYHGQDIHLDKPGAGIDHVRGGLFPARLFQKTL